MHYRKHFGRQGQAGNKANENYELSSTLCWKRGNKKKENSRYFPHEI